MRKLMLALLSALLLVCSFGCTKVEDKPQAQHEENDPENKPDLQQVNELLAHIGDQKIGAVSRQLLNEVADDNPGSNVAVSPLSMIMALAMVADGAQTTTARQFEEFFGLDRASMRALMGQVMLKLMDVNGSTILQLANSAWVSNRYKVSEEYLKAIKEYFGAEGFNEDLTSKKTVDKINGWVSEKTRKLIEQTVDQPFDESTVMLLFNTLYFKATWMKNYDETTNGLFNVSENIAVDCPMMHKRSSMKYVNNDLATGIVDWYDDGRTAFIALKPNQSMQALLEGIGDLAKVVEQAQDATVALTMPKFTQEFDQSYVSILKDMGLKDAFGHGADFSGIGEKLALSDVFQKVKVIVDEEGTEAAAVTGIAVYATGLITDVVEVSFDEPFVYFIYDQPTGMILFEGMINNPTE